MSVGLESRSDVSEVSQSPGASSSGTGVTSGVGVISGVGVGSECTEGSGVASGATASLVSLGRDFSSRAAAGSRYATIGLTPSASDSPLGMTSISA